MYIDTHCHLSKEYYEDINQIIKENKKARVSKMIVSGCNKKDIKEVLQLTKDYPGIYATIGYHPEETNVTEQDLIELEKILQKEKIIGIGEIGLDYYYSKETKEKQKELFQEQLLIAEKKHLPVVVHTREATEDTINILKQHKVKGIIHCFSGSLETAQIYIKLGFLLGIGGVVTFKNSNLKTVVKSIPIESIVLETDSPYLTPEPYRGKMNSSKNIPIIAKAIADIKNITVKEVEKITTNNAKKLFLL